VFVSLHWGIEHEPMPHPRQVEIAHLLIDHGADAIIGHHSHVPQAIEIYRGRPILYCLGNLIFGLGDTRWLFDNYLAEIVIDRDGIQGLIIHPVSGLKEELFQPQILTGTRAQGLLRTLQLKSSFFRTGIYIKEDKGYISIRNERSASHEMLRRE
jgi:poly-gamma-glutamate synthesis protein (capsule biosynthesis protein)